MAANLLAEISASALAHNLDFLRQRLRGGARLYPVVKVDAYGHGLDQILPVLGPSVDGLAVATYEEAIHLRDKSYGGPVLVFFTPFALDREERIESTLRLLIDRDITLTVTSQREIEVVHDASRAIGKKARIHFKIDSGMNRSGARIEDAAEMLAELRADTDIDLEGAYTHFAAAEEDLEFTIEQLGRFLEAVDVAGGRDGLTLHAANSAAVLNLPESHLDLVRPGLAVYGCHAFPTSAERPGLRPALRLTTRLMQVKAVRAGEACGYGLTHVFDRPTTVGLVPIGYGDGYMRALGNVAHLVFREQPVPVVGRVAMDQIVVDLGDASSPRPGEAIEVISPEPGAPNSVENLARLAGTIPYEILCRLGPRIERRLVESFSEEAAR